MIKWATSGAGRIGYKSYSLVTAVWDRGEVKLIVAQETGKLKWSHSCCYMIGKKGTFHKNKKDGSKKV